MSKRKPSKPSRNPKIAAKAQRAAQAIVKSPSDRNLRSVRAGSIEQPQRDDDAEHILEDQVTALHAESPASHKDDPQQETLLPGNSATALRDDCQQTTTYDSSRTVLDFSSAEANVRVCQEKLLEMAQANMQFTFEFAQRLVTIASPLEFMNVILEFTNKRLAMFQKYSKEMAEFSLLR
ncbi:MAG TPA: hypothetical protein VE999_01395 [Gemmataceae bacterium]|jgi:hypothetical protein|nr:hypothetical protein [Gemmataceae bacterium]